MSTGSIAQKSHRLFKWSFDYRKIRFGPPVHFEAVHKDHVLELVLLNLGTSSCLLATHNSSFKKLILDNNRLREREVEGQCHPKLKWLSY